MKSTELLEIETSLYKKSEIHIHPNEGFELGLMNTSLDVKIFFNVTIEVFNLAETDYAEGPIVLDNKCKPGHMILGHKYWKKIGQPEKLRIFFDNNKILLTT